MMRPACCNDLFLPASMASFVTCLVLLLVPDQSKQDSQERITSQIETTEAGDLVVIQEVIIHAPLDQVWTAYTTSEGWQQWVAPAAEVELKIGGKIKTNYRQGGTVNDADANTLHIVNYVPQHLLTLQAELNEKWPEVLKRHEKQMYNVILFQPLSETSTKLVSYGIGYKETAEHRELLKFFVPANEKAYQKLIDYLE